MGTVYSHEHVHSVLFIEKLEVYLKKEELCSGCEKPVFGPGYICSQCDFLILHEACIELPHEVKSLLHPSDSLALLPTHAAGICCNACGKLCDRCFVYQCSPCNFNLDTQCASQRQTSANDCDQHAFVPILQQMQFTCEACGEERNDKAHLCGNCLLLVEPACARWPRTIKTIVHDHNLSLIFSSHQVINKHDNDMISCEVCYQDVNTEYATYYCHHCNFAAHLNCASHFEEKMARGSRPYLAEEVSGLYHKHELILNKEELSACGFQANDHSFVCAATDCKFVLCFGCATLPPVARHPYDTHKLNLTYTAEEDEDDSGEYYCLICEKKRNSTHWFYYCKECNFPCHPNCVLKYYPYTIFGKTYEDQYHPHPLTLVQTSENSPPCDSCGNPFDGVALECTQCKFIVHPEGDFLGGRSTPWIFRPVEL